jgi:hypothetical protein
MRAGAGRAVSAVYHRFFRLISGRLAARLALAVAGAGIALGAAAYAAREAASAPVSVVAFPYAGPEDGGWSGIDVGPDGTRFWAVSDRGKRTEGRLLRDAQGRLIGIDAPAPVFLPGLASDRIGEVPDAEGIDVRAQDGQAYVSFEGYARLRLYDSTWHRAHWIPDIPWARGLHRNRGFEAVARDALGRIYTLPERVSGPGAPYPLYRFTKRAWMSEADWTVATRLTSDVGWRAVGADFGPEGAFYLLERRFGLVGFASRIRRFDVLGATPGEVLAGEVIHASALGQFGNLEGLGIWADAEGMLRAVMISDDNENGFQRSEVVEVVLGPLSLASGAPGR